MKRSFESFIKIHLESEILTAREKEHVSGATVLSMQHGGGIYK